MKRTGLVRKAVSDGEVVVACAYDGWVPESIRAQLPAGFNSAQYVIAIENGKIVDIREGRPEAVIGELFRKPVLANGTPCTDCAVKTCPGGPATCPAPVQSAPVRERASP